MNYISTRDRSHTVSAAQAILQGISEDGGLFVPQTIPAITIEWLQSLCGKSYIERAQAVLSLFLTDFTQEQLQFCVEHAYQAGKFDCESPTDTTELSELYENTYLLELWKGPTCAFKDMALQLLPWLMTTAATITNTQDESVILVATSGDTGKAALEGFADVAGTSMIVFYPEDGVSAMQKRQMTTQEGANVKVCAIKGNFDDAQTGVKQIFADQELAAHLQEKGKRFSSANSINWGRLVPQIVYYISAYCDLVQNDQITAGETIHVVVPTGNFGNILAAYYAKKMGVPFDKFICASNANNVLTDFIRTGVYNKNRAFTPTISPSMDILISSNLERLLFDLSDGDDTQLKDWFAQLSATGSYTVSDSVKERLQQQFYGGCCDDDQTKETIREVFKRYSYLCDPHTAVAVQVYFAYKQATGDSKKALIASTASPYKFADDVLCAIAPESVCADAYDTMEKLQELSGFSIPQQLAALKEKPILHHASIQKEDMEQFVKEAV